MRFRVTVQPYPKRSDEGLLELICEQRGVILAERCLARADGTMAAREGNPRRDPTLRFGDTPAGLYIATIDPRPHIPERSFGPYRPLRLRPVGGLALQAAKNGRDGLLQHGGALNQFGKLRPTNGCVRADNSTQSKALNFLEASGLTEWQYEIVEVPLGLDSFNPARS